MYLAHHKRKLDAKNADNPFLQILTTNTQLARCPGYHKHGAVSEDRDMFNNLRAILVVRTRNGIVVDKLDFSTLALRKLRGPHTEVRGIEGHWISFCKR